MSIATVRIPILETIHPPYRKAREQAEKSARNLADLIREANEANPTGYGQYPGGMATKAQVLQKEAAGAELDVKLEGQQAASLAKAGIEADPAYRQVVADAVAALVGRMGPLLAYEAVHHDAAAKAITLTPLPASVVAELRELRAWIATLLRMGLLDSDKVSPTLRPLVKAVP
jgi:hypothetical protein